MIQVQYNDEKIDIAIELYENINNEIFVKKKKKLIKNRKKKVKL